MSEHAGSALRVSSHTGQSQPTDILAREGFLSLEQWLHSEQAHLLGLKDVELGTESRGRELLRLLLQASVEARGNGDVGKAIEVIVSEPGNGDKAVLYTHKRMHARMILTIFGRIAVRRVGYGRIGAPSIHPLDKAMKLPPRIYSYEIQRRLVKRSVQGPFDEAIGGIQEATGGRIPKRSAETILIEASGDFDSFYALRQGSSALGSGSILVGSVDCKGIPMVKAELAVQKVRRGKGEKAQKKKMATVAAVYTQNPRIRTPMEVVRSLFEPRDGRDRDREPGPERKRVWASLEAGKDAFIADVKREMERRDPDKKKLSVVLTDGERALQLRVCHTIRGVTLILDFPHALEKIWDCGHALYGEGSEGATEFVRERALRMLRGESSQVVKGLRQMVTKRRLTGEKRKTLLRVASYLHKNKTRMRYNHYLAQGLPIATGPVEAACKTLIKDRMERSGMRWTSQMAEAMVKMRAIYLSGDFDEYWEYHVAQEQGRLYGRTPWKTVGTVVRK